ncbi:homogentisate 1,2-dioxygenase [Algivirga pacifica]|uniref:Homogentisate 1,2-dioxygenase n=1 Tax=Algivirga pacifica TaxID=1162670 RepID=A0ABP9DE50_9BACT
MPYYYRLGEIPPKRHIQFENPQGGLYREELVSSRGFSGIYSNLYHIHQPTEIKKVLAPEPYSFEIAEEYGLKQTHLNTSKVQTTGKDYLDARLPLLANQDVVMSLCIPEERSMDYFFKNADGDEMLFVHDGAGVLISQFGRLPFKKGDYIVIPRTTIYKMEFEEGPIRLLVVDSKAPIETVSRYRNEMGQLLEHSPYCERDIHPPQALEIEDKQGKDVLIKVKKQGFLHQFEYGFSPLDVVGWDGCLYPYTLSIYDFEPITGRIHQPPPVHQTFQAQNAFVICSFVPRLFDYHPKAIPAPYNHSNIDSDEVLYYVEGNFMSRKGIDRGSFTLHPGGLPHGPHPGTVEASIGAKETEEYAVMLDTFRPLFVTKEGLQFVDENYPYSWLT